MPTKNNYFIEGSEYTKVGKSRKFQIIYLFVRVLLLHD
jgi:hypothetical protein